MTWSLVLLQLLASSIHDNRVNTFNTGQMTGTRNSKILDNEERNQPAKLGNKSSLENGESVSENLNGFSQPELTQDVKQMNYHYVKVIPNKILYPTWQHMCAIKYKHVSGSNFTAQNSFFVSCDLAETDDWSLFDYRKWVSSNQNMLKKYLPLNESLQIAFEFKCKTKNGSVILPWPAKAEYLWYVSISNCNVYDFLAEYNVNIDMPDILRVAEFINVDFRINSMQYFQVLLCDHNVISRQFDCGSAAMERYVKRNCTESIMKPTELAISSLPTVDSDDEQTSKSNIESSDIENKDVEMMKSSVSKMLSPKPDDEDTIKSSSTDTVNKKGNFTPFESEKDMIDAISKFGQKNQRIQHQCVFENFRYIDESYSSYVAKHHSHFLTERRRYPALEYYNMSHSRLTKVLDNFLQWRRYFPKIKYLDFSHNRIKHFTTLSDHGLKDDSTGILNLRHNNITTLSSEDLETLRIHSKTVYVDIRDNPFNCDCKLTNFVKELKNTSSKLLTRYKYLTEMKCAQPEQLKGRFVAQLEHDLCEALEVIILAAPLAILSTFLLILVTVLVLTIKCRKEIMILAFTRLHISLPCRKVITNEDKTYDAFIAYSEADGDWVFDTLLHRLEMTTENNGPGFKLCIHHRDFPVGGCIADNIVDKVKESHHTVLILSNNFLLSHWCKYEFKTALTQSLMEKKRHLIIIIKEELDKHLIDKDLNRCLKTFTYVKADDRLFWDKLIFALSDHERIARKQQKNNANENNINQNDVNIQLQNDKNIDRYNNNGDAVIDVGHDDKNKKRQNRQGELGDRPIHRNILQDGIWII